MNQPASVTRRDLASSPRPLPVRLAVGLSVVLLAMTACGREAPRRSSTVPVLVAQVEERVVPYELEATGTVEPIQSVGVSAQVTGPITRIAFREGDEVRAGQVLFQIDPRPFQAAVAQANAVLARDRAQAEVARLDLERADALVARQLISTEQHQQKRAAAAALAATVRADQAALTAARLDLSRATIRAPISGKTGSRTVSIGDVARENETTTPLVTINQLHPIRVRFSLPQGDLSELQTHHRSGLPVEVSPSSGDSTWRMGQLSFMDNAIAPGTGTVLLKGEFPNRDGMLWPGQFVRVRLRLYEDQRALVVPAVAVTNSQEGTYCYVVKRDTTVESRPVAVARTWRELAVIAHGLEPGETVVTDGQLRLSPGAKAVIRTPGEDRPSGGRAGDGARRRAART